jgi:hypothetical protein
MTSQAQPISTPPEPLASPMPMDARHSTGIDKHKHAGPGDSVSVAKIGMISAIGTALVTAAATIFVSVGPHNDSAGKATNEQVAGNPASGPTTITPNPTGSGLGSFDQLAINGSRSEVAVTGSAGRDVASVVVLIGPRQSGGQYWAASADVFNQQWKLVVATEPHLPEPYEVKAYYKERTAGAGGVHASNFALQPTAPTPPPPPGREVTCAVELGDSCFTGPGWGPPSVYRSDQ